MATTVEYSDVFDAKSTNARMTRAKYDIVKTAIDATPGAADHLALFTEAKANFPKGHDINGVPHARAAEKAYFEANPRLKEVLDAVAARTGIKENNVVDNIMDVHRHQHPISHHKLKVSGKFGPAAKAAGGLVAMGVAGMASAHEGNSPERVAIDAANAGINSIPGVENLRGGRTGAAIVEVISDSIQAAGVALTPATLGVSLAISQVVNDLFVGGAQLAGVEGVANANIRNMLASAKEAIRRNPMPPALMAANTHALAMEAALLKDTTLPDFKLPDGKSVPAIDLLRSPKTRDLYVASLADDVKSGKATPEQLAAAEQFRDIEKHRLAKLEPYNKQLSTELAALVKAHGQQPATQVAQHPPETDPVKLAARDAVKFEVPPQDAGSTRMNANGGRREEAGRSA